MPNMLFTIKVIGTDTVSSTEISSPKLRWIEGDLHKVMEEASVEQLKIELIVTHGALKLEFESWIDEYNFRTKLGGYLLYEIEMLFLLHLEKWINVDQLQNIIWPEEFLKERYRLLVEYPFVPTEEDLLDFDAATDAAMLYCMIQDNGRDEEGLDC